MPAASDILQFMRGQLLQTPKLPEYSFKDETVVITGANTGLGYEAAIHFTQLGVKRLIMGCRSSQRGNAARAKILDVIPETQTVIDVWEVDLANYESVRQFADRIQTELPGLSIVIANAGISVNQFALAEELESTLTVNVVSTFLLALSCLPKLQSTAEQDGKQTHLIIIGSNVHAFADHRQLLNNQEEVNIFTDLSRKDTADMNGRYFLSKLIVMLCIREMASALQRQDKGPQKVIINCPSPGWCKTELFRTDDGGFWGRNMLRLIGRSAEVGSRTVVSAAAARAETHGQYLSECQIKDASVWTRSNEGAIVQRRVWKDLTQIIEGIAPGTCDLLATSIPSKAK